MGMGFDQARHQSPAITVDNQGTRRVDGLGGDLLNQVAFDEDVTRHQSFIHAIKNHNVGK